jgi:hypothetical protein
MAGGIYPGRLGLAQWESARSREQRKAEVKMRVFRAINGSFVLGGQCCRVLSLSFNRWLSIVSSSVLVDVLRSVENVNQ